MLNTSLYNPNVKDRMSLENFIQLTSSINVSKELVTVYFLLLKKILKIKF